jgi:heptosyltransferase-2
MPLINVLKKNGCRITVVCLPIFKDIFLSCPSVNEIITYDKKQSEKGVVNMLKFIGRLKKFEFDAAFLPQRSFKSGLMAFLAGIPQRYALKRGGGRFLSNRLSGYDWDKHEIERILALAEKAGFDGLVPEFNLKPDKDLLGRYESEFAGASRKIIGICSQSEWYTKCWPQERYHELARRLSTDFKVIIFGKERENIEGEGDNIINLTSKTTLKELIALISIMDMVVCNDTGPLHMAGALNKPVVSVFGPTAPPLGFTPYGVNYRIVETELECRPCSLHGSRRCPKGHFKCMLDIPVEKVQEAINSLCE